MLDPDNINGKRKIDANKDLSHTEATKLYGLKMQALYGDNNEPKPSSNRLISLLKWYAWDDLRGWSKSKAK